MPATYEPIATTTLGSATTTITFNSIPGTYTDLRLVYVPFTETFASSQTITFNNDTSALYSWTFISGDGATATSGMGTGQIGLDTFSANPLTTPPMLLTVDIFSYAGSTNKTCLMTGSSDKNGSGAVNRRVGLYRSTTAITSLTITSANNLAVGTTATLYGILKA